MWTSCTRKFCKQIFHDLRLTVLQPEETTVYRTSQNTTGKLKIAISVGGLLTGQSSTLEITLLCNTACQCDSDTDTGREGVIIPIAQITV